MVLHLGDDDLVTRPDRELLGARERGRVRERVRQEIQRLGDVAGEDDLIARRRVEERGHLVAGALVCVRDLAAQRVHGPGDVGVVVRVDVDLGVR